MSCEEKSQGKRIEDLCKIIWGSYDYELDIETDDGSEHQCLVRKDFGSSYGPLSTMTTLCKSEDAAWNELERMLTLWAKQVESGEPMNTAQRLDIFGGPRGKHRNVLEMFQRDMDKKKTRGREGVSTQA